MLDDNRVRVVESARIILNDGTTGGWFRRVWRSLSWTRPNLSCLTGNEMHGGDIEGDLAALAEFENVRSLNLLSWRDSGALQLPEGGRLRTEPEELRLAGWREYGTGACTECHREHQEAGSEYCQAPGHRDTVRPGWPPREQE